MPPHKKTSTPQGSGPSTSASLSSRPQSPIQRGGVPLRQKGQGLNGVVTPTSAPSATAKTTSLEELQTEEQRTVLDTIAKVRKCGLEGEVSLPQIVVCGDQSAGKSSVLEALTEIPFPRNDNLCTRYATEIQLRRANMESITIRVNPDTARPVAEQNEIKLFERTIIDFDELPAIMDEAMTVMGIGKTSDTQPSEKPRAFSRDVLSINYEGANRPQLTLIDIPGLIGTETKQTNTQDISLVEEITNHYIKQPRTICLAVVSAATDYANQRILSKVREVDPEGDRTLGVITKPDIPPAGSGSEKAYIELARNEDIFFKLGWHVVKNRKFDERDVSLSDRNELEASFFRTTNWSSVPKEDVGIAALRLRLSKLLFEHVRKELPNLRAELEQQLLSTQKELEQLGESRSSAEECKAYLAQLSVNYCEIVKAAVDGHYEGEYFHQNVDTEFALQSPSTLCRTRAVVQLLNTKFAENVRINGPKFRIDSQKSEDGEDVPLPIHLQPNKSQAPKIITRKEALEWVSKALIRSRGKELVGSFNPLIISELLKELTEKWYDFALYHLEEISVVCHKFLKNLLHDLTPEDVERRIWENKIAEELGKREKEAKNELERLMADLRGHPINYNHYYTMTIGKQRKERQKNVLALLMKDATVMEEGVAKSVDIEKVVGLYSDDAEKNMEGFSNEDALESVLSIYKVSEKTFVANVTTQVIERHIIRGLEKIFSPVYITNLEPRVAIAMASEPASATSKREHFEDQIRKLEDGRGIFRNVM
ncbi:hypothetical protein HYFRA_00004270 [Hymenoscyphus fraxineus]|uniref:Interferon-induced GTP-binding protein Mx n=1 Tax=Hymenoscyphus fraxineus TaxID=746836 RepID=A0A9N9PF52_9HELO|nr:hypothetical protein HYFRA_00004270 [Hymenoscyphus fraxineus]